MGRCASHSSESPYMPLQRGKSTDMQVLVSGYGNTATYVLDVSSLCSIRAFVNSLETFCIACAL